MRRLWLLLVLLLGLLGCGERASGPSLLRLVDLSPGRAEVGDRVEIGGEGLPEGRKATLTFRGDLFRPGMAPERGVKIVVGANSTSSTRVGFMLTDAIETEFCGQGDAALHTTFRGDVVAAFAPRKAGAPPVAGSLADVVLDLPGPTVTPAVRDARAAEGVRVAQALGMTLEPGPRGLAIKELVPGGRADAAGLLAEDVLVEYDGLNLLEPADLAVAAGAVWGNVKLERANQPEAIERRVDVTAVRRGMPRDLAVPGMLVAAATLLLLLLAFPGTRLVSWLSRLTAERVRQGARGPGLPLERLKNAASQGSREPTAGRVLSYFVIALTSAGSASLAFGQPLIQRELDLGVVVVAYMLVCSLGGLVTGGFTPRGWSLFKGLRGALRAAWLRVPVALAALMAVLVGGNMRLGDLVAAQEAVPWGWAGFTNPVLLVAFVLMLATATVRDDRDASELTNRSGPSSRLTMVVDAFHMMVIAHLAAILFLGGWKLSSDLGSLSQVLGAFLVQLKAWGVAALVMVVRLAVPRLTSRVAAGPWTRWVVPASVLTCCLAGLWGTRAMTLSALSPLLGVAMFAATVVLVAVFLYRTRKLSRGSAPMHVNPWL